MGPWESVKNEQLITSFSSSNGMKKMKEEPEKKPINHKRLEKL
jgi:hypothetical protein